MDNNGLGIQSLIPKKTNSSQPPIGDRGIGDASDAALEQQISLKIDKMIGPLSAPHSDFLKENHKEQTPESIKNEAPVDDYFKAEPEIDKNKFNHQKLDRIFYLEVKKIKPNPEQPRHYFSEESISELSESIREYGILEPLIVYRTEKDTDFGREVEYYLIAGERRLQAAKKIGLETVPAIIRETSSEREKLEMALIENIQREDLSVISKAKAFARLMNEFGLSQRELGERLGKSREVIANTLRLLQLPYEAQKAIDENKINEGHARAILILTNPQKRLALLGEILTKNLSGREAEDLAKRYMGFNNAATAVGSKPRKQNYSLDPNEMELKEKLENIFQTPVMIKKKGGQGEIALRFYSEDDLNKIVELMLRPNKQEPDKSSHEENNYSL